MPQSDTLEPFLQRLQARIDADPKINVSNLAVKAGLGDSAIRLMIRDNRSPRIETARKICDALGTTLEEFMSTAQTPEEQEIVRLVSQLPEPLRDRLLGYGYSLLDQHNRSDAPDREETQ